MVKAFLDKHGVPYDNIDVGEDSNAAKKMIEISGQRGVPVIVVEAVPPVPPLLPLAAPPALQVIR